MHVAIVDVLRRRIRKIPAPTVANPNALISTDCLAAHHYETSIRVIDVDEDTTAYEDQPQVSEPAMSSAAMVKPHMIG
jgi:hypothetical protein